MPGLVPCRFLDDLLGRVVTVEACWEVDGGEGKLSKSGIALLKIGTGDGDDVAVWFDRPSLMGI